MKSNIEYLKDAIARGRFEEYDEWVEAIENELNSGTEINDLKTELEKKDEEISDLQEEIEGYQENWIDPDQIETIDCGIGVIKYQKPDNLKLQMRMESLKEKMEMGALH